MFDCLKRYFHFSVERNEENVEIGGELVTLGQHRQNFLCPAGVFGELSDFFDHQQKQQQQQPINYSSSPPKIVPLFEEEVNESDDGNQNILHGKDKKKRRQLTQIKVFEFICAQQDCQWTANVS